MSKKFVILHLSDTHLGKCGYDIDSQDVLEPLLRDIEKMVKERNLIPDLIIFTGDLAFGEQKDRSLEDQYIQAVCFLENVCNRSGVKYGDVPIVIVPGNHDVNRELIDEHQKKGRSSYNINSVADMMRENNITWQRLLERQKQWYVFAKNLPGNHCVWNDKYYSSHSILNCDGCKVGIVGLNTCWASHEQDERGDLWIGRVQRQEEFSRIKDTDFKIVATHHPVDWLHVDERRKKKQKIESNFDLHLHGHDHAGWFLHTDGHLRVEAGACYEGSGNEGGYSWIEIEYGCVIKLHLRQYSDQSRGYWRCNEIEGKTDSSGIAVIDFWNQGHSRKECPSVGRRRAASSEVDNKTLKVAPQTTSVKPYAPVGENVAKIITPKKEGGGFFDKIKKMLLPTPTRRDEILKSNKSVPETETHNSKDRHKAIKSFEEEINANPNNYKLWHEYGNYLLKWANNSHSSVAIHLLQTAESKYERATQIKPKHANAWNNYGITLKKIAKLRHRMYASAEEVMNTMMDACDKYREACNLDKSNYEYYANWGIALAFCSVLEKCEQTAKNHYHQAEEKYKKALDLNPDDREALFNLGCLMSHWSEKYIAQAEKRQQKGEDLSKKASILIAQSQDLSIDNNNRSRYVVAKACALWNNETSTRQCLLEAGKEGELPTIKEAMLEECFKEYAEKRWFKELLWKK